jgi:carnitine O-acetyltransferase
MDQVVEVQPSRQRGDSTNSRSREAQRLPFIFADGGWDKLNTTVLSTSNCGNPSLRQFGFGPTSGDGFGIGYIIKDDCISICVSSKHRQTKRFVDTLESYLLEIRRILRITNRKSSSAKSSRAREAELTRPKQMSRLKSRGRLITAEGNAKGSARPDSASQTEESAIGSDDDELGGCKFLATLQASLVSLHTNISRWFLRCRHVVASFEGKRQGCRSSGECQGFGEGGGASQEEGCR